MIIYIIFQIRKSFLINMRVKSSINIKLSPSIEPETSSRKYLVKLGTGTTFQQNRKKGLTLSQSLSRFKETQTQTQDMNKQTKIDHHYTSKNIYRPIQISQTVRQKYLQNNFQQQNLLISQNQRESQKLTDLKPESVLNNHSSLLSQEGLEKNSLAKRHSFSQHHSKTQIHFTYEAAQKKKDFQIKTRPQTSYQSNISYGDQIIKSQTKDSQNIVTLSRKNLWKTKQSLNEKQEADDPYGLLFMKQKKYKQCISQTCLETEFIQNSMKCSLQRRLEHQNSEKNRQSRKSLWDARKVTSIVSVPQKSQFSIQQSKVVRNFFDHSDFY